MIFINATESKIRQIFLLVILNMFLHEVGTYLCALMRDWSSHPFHFHFVSNRSWFFLCRRFWCLFLFIICVHNYHGFIFFAWICACIKCFTSICEACTFWVCIRVISFEICMTRVRAVPFFFLAEKIWLSKRKGWVKGDRPGGFFYFLFLSSSLS